MRTIQDYDRELEVLGKQHTEVWGKICQLRMERNFELMRLARQTARTTPVGGVQMSAWNNGGHVNDFGFEELT